MSYIISSMKGWTTRDVRHINSASCWSDVRSVIFEGFQSRHIYRKAKKWHRKDAADSRSHDVSEKNRTMNSRDVCLAKFAIPKMYSTIVVFGKYSGRSGTNIYRVVWSMMTAAVKAQLRMLLLLRHWATAVRPINISLPAPSSAALCLSVALSIITPCRHNIARSRLIQRSPEQPPVTSLLFFPSFGRSCLS